MPKRIGIIAGELSGDKLGAGLIRELKQYYPDAVFEGIGGPGMIAEGFKSLVPMEKLSVMGIFEVLKHLPELLAIRKKIIMHMHEFRPDVFIGIDSPDFNLPVEERLRKAGLKTVHYVSPSVWAWREKRVFKIKRAVDLILTLLPFESTFYDKYDVKNVFVGHPLADEIPLEPVRVPAEDGVVRIGLLPGSRLGEVERLAPVFLQAAAEVYKKGNIKFLAALPTDKVYKLFINIKNTVAPELPIEIKRGHASLILPESDFVMATSGTVTLEALLYKVPMIVAYSISPLTYRFVKLFNLVKVDRFSLPNLLGNRDLVPEFIQNEATPGNLANKMRSFIDSTDERNRQIVAFKDIHECLRCDADKTAANAVQQLIEGRL